MWPKKYRDYKRDQPLVQNQVSASHGIIGCEMHEINGWGETWHGRIPQSRKLPRPSFNNKSTAFTE